MNFKVVPFVASITEKETTDSVARQLQMVINQYTADGWEYVRMENVNSNVAGTNGCFGFGAKPAYLISCKIIVFKK